MLHEFVMSCDRSLESSNYSNFSLLIQEDPNVCYFLNNEGKSPLYIAAEAGRQIYVKDMLEIGKNQGCHQDLLKGMSPLLPATKYKDTK